MLQLRTLLAVKLILLLASCSTERRTSWIDARLSRNPAIWETDTLEAREVLIPDSMSDSILDVNSNMLQIIYHDYDTYHTLRYREATSVAALLDPQQESVRYPEWSRASKIQAYQRILGLDRLDQRLPMSDDLSVIDYGSARLTDGIVYVDPYNQTLVTIAAGQTAVKLDLAPLFSRKATRRYIVDWYDGPGPGNGQGLLPQYDRALKVMPQEDGSIMLYDYARDCLVYSDGNSSAILNMTTLFQELGDNKSADWTIPEIGVCSDALGLILVVKTEVDRQTLIIRISPRATKEEWGWGVLGSIADCPQNVQCCIYQHKLLLRDRRSNTLTVIDLESLDKQWLNTLHPLSP